jgi:hypothetical protein
MEPIEYGLHIDPPRTSELLPFLRDHWPDSIIGRGFGGSKLSSYLPSAALSYRPDFANNALRVYRP